MELQLIGATCHIHPDPTWQATAFWAWPWKRTAPDLRGLAEMPSKRLESCGVGRQVCGGDGSDLCDRGASAVLSAATAAFAALAVRGAPQFGPHDCGKSAISIRGSHVPGGIGMLSGRTAQLEYWGGTTTSKIRK